MSDEITLIGDELYVYVRHSDLTTLRWEAGEYRRMRAATMRNTLTMADHTVWMNMGHAGRNVDAIKHIRTLLGSTLREAKSVYDTWRETGKVELP